MTPSLLMMGYRHGNDSSPFPSSRPSEPPLTALGPRLLLLLRLLPPERAGERRPAGGGAPLGPLAAHQLAAGAAGGPHQGAEGLAEGHRAPHLQLLPGEGQGGLGAARQLQGTFTRSAVVLCSSEL